MHSAAQRLTQLHIPIACQLQITCEQRHGAHTGLQQAHWLDAIKTPARAYQRIRKADCVDLHAAAGHVQLRGLKGELTLGQRESDRFVQAHSQRTAIDQSIEHSLPEPAAMFINEQSTVQLKVDISLCSTRLERQTMRTPITHQVRCHMRECNGACAQITHRALQIDMAAGQRKLKIAFAQRKQSLASSVVRLRSEFDLRFGQRARDRRAGREGPAQARSKRDERGGIDLDQQPAVRVTKSPVRIGMHRPKGQLQM